MFPIKSSFSNIESNHLIFDLAPFPMWIYDLETYAFLAVNQEAVRHYGYSESDFLHMTLKDIRPIEDIPILEKTIAETRLREEVFKDNGLFRHQKKDGSILYAHLKSNLISYQGKKAEIVTAIDLTERYKWEEEIEKQKQLLAIVGKVNEIFLKSDSWFKALNQCFQLLGDYLQVYRICFYEKKKVNIPSCPSKISWCAGGESVLNPPFWEFQEILITEFPHYQESILAGKCIEILCSDLPDSKTKDFLHNQGVKSLLEIPLMINNGLEGILTVENSIHDRKWKESETQVLQTLISNLAHVVNQDKMRQQLADSEVRFRTLVQNGSDLIAIIDSLGNYKYVAPTSLNVLGIPAEEFIGKNAFEFIHENDIPRLTRDLELLMTEDKVSIEPYRFQDSQKNWRWIQTDLTNHLEDPVIAGIVANTREVTHEVEKKISIQLLASLTKAISHPGSMATCLTDAMREISRTYDFSIVEVWLIAEDKSRLDLISKSGNPDSMKMFYSDKLHIHSFEKGVGLVGRLWEVQQTQMMQEIGHNQKFLRRKAAEISGLQTALGIPLMYNKEFLGCLLCLSSHAKNELVPHVKLLSELGIQIGPVIKQKMTEEQYSNFFNISPDPHGLLGFDGYLKKVNNAFVKVLGYDKSELLSKPVFQFLLEEDIPHGKKRLNELIQGAPTDSFEARFVTKEGRIKWLVWRGTVILESKIIIAAAKDITDQKEADKKLHDSNERLKRAQKIAKLGYWFRDFNKDKTEWSEEAYAIHGYTSKNFSPTFENVTQTFHPDDRYLLESDPNEHLESGKIKSFEHRIITASNQIKWVHQEIRMLVDENQMPYRIEGTIQDITERKENEIELALGNERFRLAIKASNEMIWEVDHQQETINRGDGYRRLINYTENEPFIRENSWLGKLHPSEVERVWNSIQVALADKNRDFWSSEYMIITEDGSVAYFVDRCFILRDTEGNPIRSVGSALDVTNSRQQLERIKKQNEKLMEIAWLQSHVIRAPLSRIMGLIYLMKEYDGGGKSVEEIIDLISVSAEEMDQVIEAITNKTEEVKEDDKTNPID